MGAGARRPTLGFSRAGCALPDNSHDCWVDACAVRRVTAPRFICLAGSSPGGEAKDAPCCQRTEQRGLKRLVREAALTATANHSASRCSLRRLWRGKRGTSSGGICTAAAAAAHPPAPQTFSEACAATTAAAVCSRLSLALRRRRSPPSGPRAPPPRERRAPPTARQEPRVTRHRRRS